MIYFKLFFVAFFTISYSLQLNAQKEIVFNKGEVNQVSSIDWEKFEPMELQGIHDILDKKDILILSEEDHGHGRSVDAQSMILKMLIDSSKIHTLYIEANWINCQKIMETLGAKGMAGKKDAEKFIYTYEMKYWVKTGFWDYLTNKIIDGTLSLKGFDMAGLSPIIAKELFAESLTIDFSKNYSDKNVENFKEVKADFDFFEGWGTSSYVSKDGYGHLKEYISGIINYYSFKKNDKLVEQWESILNCFYWMYKRSDALVDNKYSNQILNDKQNSLFHSMRDSMMATIFLKEYLGGSNKKIVCTMASYHAMRNSSKIENIENCCKDNGVNIMGEILDKKLPGKIYNMCFITVAGKYGIDDLSIGIGTDIKKPKKGSLEFSLDKQKNKYCFIDLTNLKNNDVFYMNAVFNKYLRSSWKNNFSGVFFIKEMKPLSLITWHK